MWQQSLQLKKINFEKKNGIFCWEWKQIGENKGLEEKEVPGIREFFRNDQKHVQADVP